MTSAMENAVIVWTDGNENLSGGSTFDQQCGSIWQGLGRWLNLFSALKTKMPRTAAKLAARSATNLSRASLQLLWHPNHPKIPADKRFHTPPWFGHANSN